ncbi:MAG: autotransporter-associated beta strand repeat-containing protein [Verrucomicrobiota bacterium]
MAVLFGAAVFVGGRAHAQLIYTESFRFESAPGWEFRQDSNGTDPPARLTANAVPNAADPESGTPQIDVNGNGWLRLATTTGNQANAVALDTAIPATDNTIRISFDYSFWKPDTAPADGITVFLWDAGQAFDPGAFGGSLGYANRTGVDGLSGAYVGVGLDVYGNFSNPTEDRNGGVGFRPNEVAIRGAGSGQTGYDYIEGTGDGTNPSLTSVFGSGFSMDFINSPSRPDQDADDYRGFQLELDENDVLTIWLQDGFSGTLTQVLQTTLTDPRPDQLRVGFAGSTGGSVEVYEIRNLEIETTGGTNAFYWDNEDGDQQWGTGTNWDQDVVPTDHSFVVFSDLFPDTMTDQLVEINGGDKTISTATFTGTSSYTLTPESAQTLIFDTDGNGKSYLNVLNSPNGNADHTINADIQASGNDLDIQNLVDQTLTLNGDIDGAGNDLGFESAGLIVANGAISDSSGTTNVTVTGNGETQFAGSNTYSGTTTVGSAGGDSTTLTISNAIALGTTGAATTVLDGSTLALENNITFAAETVNITGSGVDGVGALFNSSGTNTWDGNINLAGDATIGAASGTSLTLDTGTLDGVGNEITFLPESGATITVDQTITDSSGTTNVVFDGAGMTEIGFFQNNTYEGTTTIRSGTVLSGSSVGAFGEEAFGASSSNIELGDGGTDATDNITLSFDTSFFNHIVDRQIDINNSGATTTLGVVGNNTLNYNAAVNLAKDLTVDAVDISGAIGAEIIFDNDGASGELTGTGDITKTGNGIMTLRGGHSRTGDLNINGGTVNVEGNGASALDNSGRVTLADVAGAQLNIIDSEVIGSLAGGGASGGNVAIDVGQTLTAGFDGTDSTFSGTVSGFGNLTKEGAGNLTFDGTNTFTGTLLLDEGTVTAGADNTFNDSMAVDFSGGTLAIDGVTDTVGGFNLSSDSTLDFLGAAGGTVTFGDLDRTAGDLTVDNWIGSLSGGGDTQFRFTGTDSGFTSGASADLNEISFTGWGTGADLVDFGTYQEIVPSLNEFFIWDGSTGNSTWTTVANWQDADGNAVSRDPDLAGDRVLFSDLDPSLNGDTIQLDTDITLGVLVIDNDDAFTISSDNNGDEFFFDNNGSDAFLTVQGSSSPTIDREIEMQDDLVITNNSSGTLTITDATSGGFDINTSNSGSNELTFRGTGFTLIESDIIGSGSVVKTGSGTLRLTDNSTVTGGFTIEEGTVQAANNQAFGTGTIDIDGGTIEAFGSNRNISEAYNINNDFTFGNADGSDILFSGNGVLAAGEQTITVENGITATLGAAGNLTGTGSIVKEGDGTLAFGGNDNSFSGDVTINDGTAEVSSGGTSITLAGSQGSQNFMGTGDVTVNSGGTLSLSNTVDLTIASGGTVTNTGGTITANIGNGNNDDIVFAGNFNQTGGNSTFTASDNIRQTGTSQILVSGGDLALNLQDDFSTGDGGSTFSTTNGATSSVTLNTGVGSSQFTLSENDFLTVDGSGSTLTVTTEDNGSVNLDGTIQLSNSGQMIVAQGPTTFGANSTFDGSDALTAGTLEVRDDLTFTSGMDIANAPNITLNIAGGDSSVITAAAASTNIENLGVITKTGDGDTTIGSNLNNLQGSKILINGGTLFNSSDNQIENNTALEFADNGSGVTTPTWNLDDRSEVLGSLTLSNNSTVELDFGSDAGDGGVVQFADSSGALWSGSGTLSIDNWNGSTSGGGLDQLFAGSSSSGLTSSQLSRIKFFNPAGLTPGVYDARILSTGEIVPVQAVPEPGTYLAGAGLVGLLVVLEIRRRQRQQSISS